MLYNFSLWPFTLRILSILCGANFAILCGCFFRLSGILQGFPILSGSIDGSGRAVPDPLPVAGFFLWVILQDGSGRPLPRVQLLPVRLMCPDSSSTSAAPFRCGLSGSCPAVPGSPDPFACGLFTLRKLCDSLRLFLQVVRDPSGLPDLGRLHRWKRAGCS